MRRIGGREQAGVDAPPGQIALYLLHVGVKTDGKHAVGLVKDQFAQVAEVQGATQQVVQHTARGTHNKLRTVAQGVHLLFVTHAAVNGHGNNARALKQHGGLTFHLHGQFPRGGQHKRLGSLEVGRKPGQHGQQVAARFTAARARLHHDVAPFQQVGQRQRLHRHETLPAGAGTGGAHVFGHVFQVHPGQGIFRFTDGKPFKGSFRISRRCVFHRRGTAVRRDI